MVAAYWYAVKAVSDELSGQLDARSPAGTEKKKRAYEVDDGISGADVGLNAHVASGFYAIK